MFLGLSNAPRRRMTLREIAPEHRQHRVAVVGVLKTLFLLCGTERTMQQLATRARAELCEPLLGHRPLDKLDGVSCGSVQGWSHHCCVCMMAGSCVSMSARNDEAHGKVKIRIVASNVH